MPRRARFVLGVTGPPGAGKSTLAEALVGALGADAVLVPMDGFHHFQTALEAMGRADRKGAPDTFDVDGFVALLEGVRSPRDRAFGVPAFDRQREDPVADAIVVLPSHRIVVTEGNYLLGESGGWERVRELLDECWYVDVDPRRRVDELIARHVQFGRTPAAAEEWVMRSDEANARLVEATRSRADRIVTREEEIDALVRELRASADQTR